MVRCAAAPDNTGSVRIGRSQFSQFNCANRSFEKKSHTAPSHLVQFDALYTLRYTPNAGWSSLVARRAHNPKVVSSNLTPATNLRLTGRAQAPGLFVFIGKEESTLRSEYPKTQVPKGGTWATRRQP